MMSTYGDRYFQSIIIKRYDYKILKLTSMYVKAILISHDCVVEVQPLLRFFNLDLISAIQSSKLHPTLMGPLLGITGLLQIYQKQKDRKLLAPCTIFNKSKSLLWATWFICLSFLSSQFTEATCFYWIWYKEPGVFCLSVSDRSVVKCYKKQKPILTDYTWSWAKIWLK